MPLSRLTAITIATNEIDAVVDTYTEEKSYGYSVWIKSHSNPYCILSMPPIFDTKKEAQEQLDILLDICKKEYEKCLTTKDLSIVI